MWIRGITYCAALAIGGAPLWAVAGDVQVPWRKPAAVQPSCEALPSPGNPSSCGNPNCPHCGCQPPTTREGPPPDEVVPREGPPLEEEYPREVGFYQAPPRTGGFQGPARSWGLNLGALTLPELRLRLPTIELPSCYRVHQQARMVIDHAHAPWVATGVEQRGVAGMVPEVGYPRQGPPTQASQPRDAPSPGCERTRDYEAKLQELQRKIEECEQLKRSIQEHLDARSGGTCPTPARGLKPLPSPPVPEPDASRHERPAAVQPAAFLLPVPRVRRLPPQ